MKLCSVFLLLLLSLSSCNYKEATESAAPDTSVAYDIPSGNTKEGKDDIATLETTTPSSQTYCNSGIKIVTKIIRTASVEFQVQNTEESHLRIAQLLAKHSAYFGSDNRSSSSYRVDNNMSIRVPSQQFDKLLEELMEESVFVNYKNISAEDVTEQFVDTEARLKTKKEVEQRYLALLREAKKVQDILDIEDKLRVIREEIEAAEGKLKLMNDQVNYSTINLNTYQNLDYVPQPETGFLNNLQEAFVRGWRGLIDFVVGIVRIWPLLIIAGIALGLAVRKLHRRNTA